MHANIREKRVSTCVFQAVYKGALHCIIQGTSSRPLAAAAVQIIFHKARHTSCYFLIRCLKNEHVLSFSKTSLDVPCKNLSKILLESR